MSVLVFGATGNIGQPLTAQLARRGVDVTGVSRSPGEHPDTPVPLISVEASDAPALDMAVAASDQVVIIGANTPDQAATEIAIVDAAARAGIRQLVKVSSGGTAADSPLALGRDHFAIEEHLAASAVPATVIRPGFLMQNLLAYAAWIEDDGSWQLPMGEGRLSMVDARDIGEAIAAALTDDNHIGGDYSFTGTEAIDLATAAETLATASGRPLRYRDTTGDRFRARLLADGYDKRYADDLTILYDNVIRAGHAATISDALPTMLGRDPITFAAFARDYAASFALDH